MRLSISNIAWDPADDVDIAQLLQCHGIDAIDVAPSKYFPDLANASDFDIRNVRAWWARQGVEIRGMQSLLFGTNGLNLFGAPEVQDAMLAHLTAVCHIGAGLGANRLVFGSPKNRDRTGISDERAMEMAVAFFRRLGGIAENHGQLICLEPNPASYGANFMTTSLETADVVKLVGHPAIKMQLDTGALAMNDEDILDLLPRHACLIGHVHASEPGLATLGEGSTDHAAISAAVKKHLPDHLVCIEMLAPDKKTRLASVEKALNTAITHYREHTGAVR